MLCDISTKFINLEYTKNRDRHKYKTFILLVTHVQFLWLEEMLEFRKLA